MDKRIDKVYIINGLDELTEYDGSPEVEKQEAKAIVVYYKKKLNTKSNGSFDLDALSKLLAQTKGIGETE